jgi:hypothetical protein
MGSAAMAAGMMKSEHNHTSSRFGTEFFLFFMAKPPLAFRIRSGFIIFAIGPKLEARNLK